MKEIIEKIKNTEGSVKLTFEEFQELKEVLEGKERIFEVHTYGVSGSLRNIINPTDKTKGKMFDDLQQENTKLNDENKVLRHTLERIENDVEFLEVKKIDLCAKERIIEIINKALI